MPVISAENWKPAAKADQVIQPLMALVSGPQPEHPLRDGLAKNTGRTVQILGDTGVCRGAGCGVPSAPPPSGVSEALQSSALWELMAAAWRPRVAVSVLSVQCPVVRATSKERIKNLQCSKKKSCKTGNALVL